jgi:type IV fimbrial biogenesis protein FimT
MDTRPVFPLTSVSAVRLPCSAGVTLVELMVVIAISAILLGIATPSFVDFIKGQSVKTASADITSALAFARSEAIKRNSDVVITPAGAGWQGGWAITATVSGAATTLNQQSAYKNITITGPATDLTYGGDGRVKGGSAPTFQISGDSNIRCVSVSLSGVAHSKTGAC